MIFNLVNHFKRNKYVYQSAVIGLDYNKNLDFELCQGLYWMIMGMSGHIFKLDAFTIK